MKKVLKNLLTNESGCDIIYRLSARGTRNRKEPRKKLKKVLKNLLTNESDCDIINRLPTRRQPVFAEAKPTKLIEN